MPSIIPGYEYDIFISYRQNDNQDGWVTEFVENLNREIKSTFKEQISIYFDENPYDGLRETHDVDDSLARKLKCLIFIPVISKTYCDPNSFAWTNEFLVFKQQAENDEYGLKVSLPNGNTASRILPIRIHDVDDEDKQLVENEIGFLRAIDFVYQEPGVNRPLKNNDDKQSNLNKTSYANQINKVANSIHEIIKGVRTGSRMAGQKQARPESQGDAKPVKVKTDKKGILWGTLAVLIVAAISYFLMTKDSGNSAEEIDKSIAVIPFENLSNDEEQQYFADGVMEDILTQLQRMGDLRVTSRTSVEQYRDSKKSAPVIGDELNVSYLLEGSVRKSGNQIMITVQLIRASDDRHIWADNFPSEYTMEGLFDIQRRIAENIVSKLKVEISPDRFNEITEVQTINKEAYEHFIRARLLYGQQTYASNEKSIEEFKLSIKADPNYSAAYGGLATSFIRRNWSYGFPRNWRDSSVVYANRGIELNENCAECYAALAFNINTSEEEFSKSNLGLEYYEKALSINPNYERARASTMIFYLWQGNFRKAFESIALLNEDLDKAQRLSFMHYHISNAGTAKEYAEAALRIQKDRFGLSLLTNALVDSKEASKLVEVSEMLDELTVNDGSYDRGILLSFWVKGDYESFVKYYEEKEFNSSMSFWHCTIYSYYKVGKTEIAKKRALDDLNKLKASYNNNLDVLERNWQYYNLGFYYLMLDEKEKALASLEKAVDMGWLRDLDAEPIFETIRNEPRFRAMVEKQKENHQEVMALYATYNFPKPEELK